MDTNRDAGRWGALGDGTRLAIVARLADGPEAVGELAAGLPVTRPAVSQHLKILKDAGTVPAGKPSPAAWTGRKAGRCTWTATPRW